VTGSYPNEEGLRSLGRAVDEHADARGAAHRRGRKHASGKKPHKRRWLKRTLLITLAVVVLAVAAAAGYGWYLNHKIHRINVNNLDPNTTTGADANTENILMVGSTTRCGLAHQTPAYGLCTQGVTGVNSDVIMIMHLNPNTKHVSILSLPRDLFIPNSRSTGAYKIDSALAQGPSQLVAAIEEDFAIPIQRYVEVTFDSFAEVVDQLGGITMDFPIPVFDRYSGLKILKAGCYHLDGKQALSVVRARHLQYWVAGQPTTYPYTWPQEALSDLARIRRDHEFLKVLASQVQKRGIGNPASDVSLINAIAPHLTVDSGFSASDMIHLALTYHGVDVGKAPTYTLPVSVDTFGTYIYQGAGCSQCGDIEFPSQPVDQSTIDTFLGVGSDTNTMTGQPLPSPQAVTVSVLNGTGTYDQATQTSSALGNLGFHMVGIGNTTALAQYTETLVTYSQRTPQDEAAAQLVADSLSGAVILHYGPTADGAQVTVTTGTNFTVDPTAPQPGSGKGTGTPASTTSTSTTTAGTTGSGATASTTSTSAFGAPSSATNPLEPWDPRACSPGTTAQPDPW
jgi:LCP family protein required for cell wall assembly